MIISDICLRSLLASFSFVSHLFNPFHWSDNEDTPHSVINSACQIAAPADLNVQACPLNDSLGHLEQDSDLHGFLSWKTRRSIYQPNNQTSGVKTGGGSNPPHVIAQSPSCATEEYSSPITTVEKFPPFERANADVFRYRQQRGVNLGSWFLHEKWMTPAIFKCAAGKRLSELDIASGYGSVPSARAVLEQHWDTFITARDFEYLASIGINTVRIPIGYWSLGPSFCRGTPFERVADVYRTSWAHVVHAINIAASVDIGVLIDLHGAVGSQNGHDHSGISDGKTNLFTNRADQDKTIEVLSFLTKQLSTASNVVGIQILNEPKDDPQLTEFYARALDTLRGISPEAAKMPFYVHDGFNMQRMHEFVASRKDFVVQDHHSYFVYTGEDKSQSADKHTQNIKNSKKTLAKISNGQRNNLVIHEFSCALAPQSLSQSRDTESAHKCFCEAQIQVYQNSTAGWSFWNYNKEGCEGDGSWCFKRAVGKYLPSTFFSYPRSSLNAAVMSELNKVQPPSAYSILQRYNVHGMSKQSKRFEAHSRRALNPMAARSLEFSGYNRHFHRFATIHARHQSEGPPLYFSPTPESPGQTAVLGYGDGFKAALAFAAHGLSKLGFVGQHIEDLHQLHGDTIKPGQEGTYREWFRKGLKEAEDIVQRIVSTVA